MAHLFDFALLVIAACSALYCWTLSRRLRALQNLRKGVGRAVVNLTQSVSAVETNAEKLNREARAAVAELKASMAQVDGCEAQVDTLLETMDGQVRAIWDDFSARSETAKKDVLGAEGQLRDTTKMLRDLIKDAKTMAEVMNGQLMALAERDRVQDMREAALLEKIRQEMLRFESKRAAEKSHGCSAGPPSRCTNCFTCTCREV